MGFPILGMETAPGGPQGQCVGEGRATCWKSGALRCGSEKLQRATPISNQEGRL